MAGNPDAFQQAMNQGHSAAWDQSWERAAGFYRRALKEDPNSIQALTSLGLALIELQEYEDALGCYQKAARVAPEDPLPLEKVTQLCERLGQLDMASQAALRAAELYLKNRDANKAIENWERVTRLNPENLVAHHRLAVVFERLGEKHRAVKEYLALASLLQSSGDPERAYQMVQTAVKILPDNQEAQQAVNLLRDFKPLPRPIRPRGGTAPLRMSQVKRLEAPQAAAEPQQDPVSAACQKALTVLAGMLFDTAEEDGEMNTSRRGLQAIVSGALGLQPRQMDRTRMVLHLSQVVDLQTRGEYAQAADELQRAVEVGLENMAAAFDLGYLSARTGRAEQAVRQLQVSVKHSDYALGSRLLLGDLLRKKGQLKEAALEYLEALKLADAQMAPPEYHNDLLQLYDLLIESQRRQNDPDLYNRICDNVQELLDRRDWRNHLRQARQQLPGMEGSGTPIPLAEILVEARSSQVINSVALIHEMMQRAQNRSAMEEAFYAIEDAPTYLPLHALMAEMLAQSGETEAASEKLQVIMRTYAMRGEAQQTINFARRVVDLAPTDLSARKNLIDQLVAFGKAESAIDEYIHLAEVYYAQADLNQARKTYQEALRIGQQMNVERGLRVKILYRIADIDTQSLEWRQALRVLEQVRTLQPEDANARNQIIALNFRLGQEAAALTELDNYIAYLGGSNRQGQLIQYLETLSADYPERIPVRRRLVDAYRQAGRTSDAVHQLDSLGETFLQNGDRAAAIQTVEMIISLNPPNRREYLQLLDQLRGES